MDEPKKDDAVNDITPVDPEDESGVKIKDKKKEE